MNADQPPLLVEPCDRCGGQRTIVRALGLDVATCICCGGGGLPPDARCPHGNQGGS